MKRVLYAAVGGLVMCSMTAGAAVSDITINDTIGTGTGWYSPNRENQEVEIGNIANQSWDLERFLLDTTTRQLQIQGGFNMVAGNSGFYSGDVFIDVNGNAQWGSGITTDASPGTANGFFTVPNSQYGWDYVINFDRSGTAIGGSALTGGYSVYSLGGATDVQAYYDQNNQSNPNRYLSGGTLVTSVASGLSQSSFSDGEGTHYVLGNIDLSWLSGLGGAAPVTFHFTESCGNDLLIGQTTSWSRVPDGGLTLVLLGGSLSALGIVSRRMRRNR